MNNFESSQNNNNEEVEIVTTKKKTVKRTTKTNNIKTPSSTRQSKSKYSVWQGDSVDEGSQDEFRKNKVLNRIKNAHVLRIKNNVLLREVNNAHDEVIRFTQSGDMASAKMMETELNDLHATVIFSNSNPYTKSRLGKSAYYTNPYGSSFNQSHWNSSKKNLNKTTKASERKFFEFNKTSKSTRILNKNNNVNRNGEEIEEEENEEEMQIPKNKKSNKNQNKKSKNKNSNQNYLNNQGDNMGNNNAYINQNEPNYAKDNNVNNNPINDNPNNDNNNVVGNNDDGNNRINNDGNDINNNMSNKENNDNNNLDNDPNNQNNQNNNNLKNYKNKNRNNNFEMQNNNNTKNYIIGKNNEIIYTNENNNQNKDLNNNENDINKTQKKKKKKKKNKGSSNENNPEEDENFNNEEYDDNNEDYEENEDNVQENNEGGMGKRQISQIESENMIYQDNDGNLIPNPNFPNQNYSNVPQQNPYSINVPQQSNGPINYTIDPKTGQPISNQNLEQQQNPNILNQNPNNNSINPNDNQLNNKIPYYQDSNQAFPNTFNPYVNPQAYPYPPQNPKNFQNSNMNPSLSPNINPNNPNYQNPNDPLSYPPFDNKNNNYPPYVPNNQRVPQRYAAYPNKNRPRPKSTKGLMPSQNYPNYYYDNNSEYPQRPILDFGKPLSIIDKKWNDKKKNKRKKRIKTPANILYSHGSRGTCFACDVNCGISRSGNSPNNYNPYEASRKEIRKDTTFYDYERDGYYKYRNMNY